MRLRRTLRTAAHCALAVCPSFLKLPIYRRVFGFQIPRDARIGCSILDVDQLELQSGASIGHGNLFSGTTRVTMGKGAEVGHANIIRGGKEVRLDDYAFVMRFNVLNSIPENDAENPTDPRLHLRPGACVVSGHRLDFTDRIALGTNVIVAGRNSSLWTHNRKQTKPIEIGDYCYLGSEVRLGPGASLAPWSVLAMGGVLVKRIEEDHVVLGGVPARKIRNLTEEDERNLRRKIRPSTPEDAY
jgi:acetyltransferase-like isoleucine patch superfamily enzyme